MKIKNSLDIKILLYNSQNYFLLSLTDLNYLSVFIHLYFLFHHQYLNDIQAKIKFYHNK